jgi:DNA polymerase-2
VFQDGSLKVRGIECRRRDTPTFIADVQMELLKWLAHAKDADELPRYLPGALKLLRLRLSELRRGHVPPEKLLVGQALSRRPTPGCRQGYRCRAAHPLFMAARPARRPRLGL